MERGSLLDAFCFQGGRAERGRGKEEGKQHCKGSGEGTSSIGSGQSGRAETLSRLRCGKKGITYSGGKIDDGFRSKLSCTPIRMEDVLLNPVALPDRELQAPAPL